MKIVLMFLTLLAISANCKTLDKIVAVVDNEIILQSELDEAIKRVSQYNDIEGEDLGNKILEDLIAGKVLYASAIADTNISINEDEIEQALSQRINGILSQVGGEKALEEKYDLSVAKLKMDYRPEVKKSLFVEKFKIRTLSDIDVNRREVESFYNENKDQLPDVEASVELAKILISFNKVESNDEEIVEQLKAIKQQVLDGVMTFEDAAIKFSEDKGSAVNGGDIGTTTRGDLFGEYEQVAYELDINQISDPVKSKVGYHVIKLFSKSGEKIHTSHILISPKPSEIGLEKAEVFAATLHDSISIGKLSFEECVRKYSDDLNSKYRDGAIGKIKNSDLDQEYLTLFKDLKPGNITSPLKKEDGYHIYKVLGKEQAHSISLDTDYSVLKDFATRKKKDEYLLDYVKDLKEKVFIDIK
jgi:peptidyl-prolyl cis-trans isomerase SurA